MSHPSGDAQNGQQVSPPPYTPLTGPAADEEDAGLIEALQAVLYEENRHYPFPWKAAVERCVEVARQHTQPAVAVEQGVEQQHCTNCGKPFEVTSDTAFLCRDCLRPTTQAAGGNTVVEKAVKELASILGAVLQMSDRAEKIGGARSIAGVAALNTMQGSLQKNAPRIAKHVVAALAALQQGGSQLAVGDSFNGPKSDGLNIGSFTRAEGGSHE